MNGFTNALSDAVLLKNFEASTLLELETLATKYPYASALQYLYTRKLQESGDERLPDQLQKTLLYYSNPVFINYLIQKPDNGISTTRLLDAKPQTAQFLPPAASEHLDFEEVVATKTLARPQTEPFDEATILEGESSDAELQQTTANSTVDIVTGNDVESNTTQVDEQNISIAPQTNEEAVVPNDAEEAASIAQAEEGKEDEPEDDAQSIDANLPPLPQFKFETVDPANAELSFTPYYTIDYFAAQGIKPGSTLNPGDKFGSQLKSFTAWLKQMKRLPGASEKTTQITTKDEKTIEHLAQQSVTGEDAHTEAMAQVWIQQGNKEKAAEIYKKLSLQNPSKSAYFAAKIEFLKKQT